MSNKEKKKSAKKGRLSLRVMGMIFLVGILIGIGAIVVGGIQYDKSIKEYYDQMAYQAAKIAENYASSDEMEKYAELAYEYSHGTVDATAVKEITDTEEYHELLSSLQHLRDSVEANDIFIVTVDMDEMKAFTEEANEKREWNPLSYIADSYVVEEENFSFGEVGSILPQFIDAVEESYQTGERYDGFYISDGGFGYNMTAMYPVVKDGRTIACIGVEIPMLTLQKNIETFVLRVSIITVIIMLLGFFVGIGASYRNVIKPIGLITSEIGKFVENRTEVSELLTTVNTGDEIQYLSEHLHQMEIDINTYIDNLQKVTAEKERIGAELNVATQIQADMLPSIFPPYPDKKEFDLYATMNPAKEVGGDFYDFFLADDDHLALVMADVSGKGVPAALFMVIAKTLIKNRTQAGIDLSPGAILEDVNEQLCEGNKAELFVTVWLAIIDINTGKGMAANAGHEHPAIRRKDGSWELVKYRHSVAVATMEGIPFREHEFELNPGDSLFVYTDGVTEATNASDELFGEERLVKALNKEPGAKPDVILKNVKNDIDEFVADAPQFDDVTMLGIDYYGTEGSSDA